MDRLKKPCEGGEAGLVPSGARSSSSDEQPDEEDDEEEVCSHLQNSSLASSCKGSCLMISCCKGHMGLLSVTGAFSLLMISLFKRLTFIL